MEVAVTCISDQQITKRWPKLEWVADAFRNIGHPVRRVTSASEVASALAECDLVVFGHKSLGGRWVNIRDAFRSRRAIAVYWWFDLIATHPGLSLDKQPLFQQFHSKSSQMMAEADIVLVKEEDLVKDFRYHGCNAYWFDQGCPKSLPEIDRQKPRWDVLVWGSASGGEGTSHGYKERKRDVCDLVKAGFSVAWACDSGTPPEGVERLPWTHPDELPKLASLARCVLSCGYRSDVRGYWSDSFWLAVGMGSCVLRRRTAGMPDGEYFTYHTTGELVDLVKWVRRNPDSAIATGRKAREWAMRNHSLDERAKSLIRLVQTAKGLDGQPLLSPEKHTRFAASAQKSH